MKKSGIYLIKNKINKMIYIGHSGDITDRFNSHKSRLRRNKHNNPRLQNSWNKYGEQNFIFKQIVTVYNITLRNELEKYIIKKFRLKGKLLYNFGEGGDAQKPTVESNEKRRISCNTIVISGKHNNARLITYNNQTLTLTAWAKIIGVHRIVLSYRLKNWTLERALTTPPNKKFGPRKNKFVSESNQLKIDRKKEDNKKSLWKGFKPKIRLITFNNEILSIADWSRKLGINQSTLRHRISNWGVEKAMTTPLRIWETSLV